MDRTSLGKGIALSVLVGVVLFAFDSLIASLFSVRPLSRILPDGAVFLLIYAGGLIALKPLVRQDVDLLRAILPSNLHGWLGIVQRLLVSE